MIGAGLSVTRFLRAPLVMFSPRRLERLSASDFCASFRVIGAGLSVTKFLRAPLVMFSPRRLERLSESLFLLDELIYANYWVTGTVLSFKRLTSASLVTFSPLSFPTIVLTLIFFIALTLSANVVSASSYGNPLSIT